MGLHANVDLHENADADKLCHVLGDHAFAVRIPGITLAVDKLLPSEMLSRFKDAPHTLKISNEFAEEGRESVSSLLSASLDALSDEAHETLMDFGALFTSSTTPELLALCMRREEEVVENELSELQKRGLAERVCEPGSDLVSYRLHDLVFSFARANNNVRIKTVTGAAKRFLEQHQHDFAVLDVELNNMLGAVENAKRTEGRLFVEMMKSLVVGDAYFEARGHSPRSFELLRAACVKAKELGELEAAHHLITKMGNTYREFYGNLDKALEAYQEALGLAQRLGNRHREAIMLSLMGVVHFQKHEDASKAYTYLEKARYLAGICGEDLTINRVLQNMSFVAGATGDHEKALTFCLEAVEAAYSFKSNSLVQKVEVDHNLFFSLLNLGVAERHLDQLESSLKTYMRALAVAQEHNNQVWMAYALQEIGETHHQVANQQLAQENYDKALELYWRNNAATDIESLTELMRKQGYQLRESYFPRQG